MSIAAVLGTCFLLTARPSGAAADDAIPEPLRKYSQPLDAGAVVAFPAVPLLKSASDVYSDNLLSDPGFEYGDLDWSVSGSDGARGAKTDVLRAEGQYAHQLMSTSKGESFLSQNTALEPRTFYRFTALVYMPGDGSVVFEVRDSENTSLVTGKALAGPTEHWTQIQTSFATGAAGGEYVVGLRSESTDAGMPILVDQAALHPLKIENVLPAGDMNTDAHSDRMATWYHRSRAISAMGEGYQEGVSFELPPRTHHPSTLVGLIPGHLKLVGRHVWISAMVQASSESGGIPVEVTLSVGAQSGDSQAVASRNLTSGLWEEIAAVASIPAQTDGGRANYQVLTLSRPAAKGGRVFVDDVRVLPLPDEHFAGQVP
jgi:hypothetical protein